MSFYRTYYYSQREDCYKHLYFPRNRAGGKKSNAESNVSSILDKLEGISKLDESLSRSRRTIRDLILCNQFDYFCTFTFNPDLVDRFNFSACKNKITVLFKNYKTRYSDDFRYILVPEFHRDGAIHFHGMVRGIRPQDLVIPEKIWKRSSRGNLIKVKNTRKYVDWTYYSSKLGFFSCSRIKDYEKCARYVSKYITKDLMGLATDQRIFMASLDLDRPELVFDCDDIPCLFGEADFQNDFVKIKETPEDFGVLPVRWVSDQPTIELRNAQRNIQPDEPLIEEDIFYPRLTGDQLKII